MKPYILKAFLLTLVLTLGFGFAQTLYGSFVGVDSGHEGAGSLELTEENGVRILEFSEDFTATREPDPFVWLVKGDDTGNFVNPGRLQSAGGAQRYTVPDVDLDEYDRMIIWCRMFRLLFSTAEFQQG